MATASSNNTSYVEDWLCGDPFAKYYAQEAFSDMDTDESRLHFLVLANLDFETNQKFTSFIQYKWLRENTYENDLRFTILVCFHTFF